MDSSSKPVIQVSTDFTEISNFAIEHATIMARLFRAKLLIVHIIDKYSRKLCKNENMPIECLEKKLAEQVENIKKTNGIEVEYIFRDGSIIQEIATAAKEHDALLHVMGTHGMSGLQHITGSFTLKVIKHSPAPVLVIQKEPGKINYQKVIFPLELHPSSKQKIKFAKLLNKHAGSSFEFFADYQNDKRASVRIRADLKQLSTIMENNGIPHNESFAKPKGAFHKQIIDFAVEKNADAILVTSDPDKFSWNPFNTEVKILYNEAKIPVIFINAQHLGMIIGGR